MQRYRLHLSGINLRRLRQIARLPPAKALVWNLAAMRWSNELSELCSNAPRVGAVKLDAWRH